jgi:hypothetical protein
LYGVKSPFDILIRRILSGKHTARLSPEGWKDKQDAFYSKVLEIYMLFFYEKFQIFTVLSELHVANNGFLKHISKPVIESV